MQPGRNILLATALCILSLFPPNGHAQSFRHPAGILFYQLNTSDGLSDNYIWDMCTDKGGNLWIATGEGLNMFNGKTVIRYFTRDYPQLREDFTRQVVCDNQNRIWILLNNGHLAVIDEQRRFHKVGLYTKEKHVATRRLLNTSQGIVVFARDNHYTIKPGTNLTALDSLSLTHFNMISIKGFDTLHTRNFSQVEPFDEDSYLFVSADSFFKVNYRSGQVEQKFDFQRINVLTKWDKSRLLLFDHTANQLQVLDLSTNETTLPFDQLRDQYGKPITAAVTNARWINPHQLILTTRKQGIYIYHADTKQLINHRHNAADPASIINNSPFVIATDSTGWVFIGATPNGISYFKSNAVIGEHSVFQDKQGNSYDGFITSIATLDNDTYFIGTSDNLLQWKRSTNATEFIDYGIAESLQNKEEIFYLAFDNAQRLWVATATKGVFVLDQQKRTIRQLSNEPGQQRVLPNQTIRHMQLAPDGYMWLSTNRGVCRVNPGNFAVDSFDTLPLKELDKILCYRTWFDGPDKVWIATGRQGAWQYTISTKQLRKYTEAEGLPSNEVYCFNKDRHNNIYIGTPRGLHILLHNGLSRTIGTEQGLLNKRVEAILRDKKDRMWIGNDVGLACFNISDSSLKAFDERYGLSIQGFRINSYHQNSDDELVWGTEKGLQYFYPDDLLQQKISLPTTINRVETRDVVTDLTQNAVFRLSAADNYVTFYFSSIDYSKHLRTFYEYKLEGIDEKWIKVVDQNFVRYSSLPAGEYTFRVRASNDDKTWEEAGNKVVIHIAKPLWRQTWFKLLGAALGLLLIWYVINFYRRKQRVQREELETEVVVNYFASRINIHQQTEDILWDIARNCISKLQFEDCVIYLLDESRNMLVQKAAWGPKMERDYTIYQPIEIPVGEGIVGTVAKTGKAELISNTELDPRYIPDDARRYSEIAVPLVIDNRVIGVIDSEHSRKNFFNQKHLNILSTIAVLCANQIQRSQAEEEKQKAKIEILQNRQKMTESRLQSLRLQMNPHFLFNALNSIQQMILANEEMVATRYLSQFSKLLRTILIHSDKETVTLKEELEILNLYVSLESVRFKDSFSYTIQCDEEIDRDEVKVPTLLVQPFVENAIWHGLMHKENGRKLTISFLERDDHLQCVIEDNGIGREKAREARMKSANGKEHKSKGIEVSLERLRAMQGARGSRGTLSIIDLKDDRGRASGTRVEINFPIQN